MEFSDAMLTNTYSKVNMLIQGKNAGSEITGKLPRPENFHSYRKCVNSKFSASTDLHL
jgi:hypothetical protein